MKAFFLTSLTIYLAANIYVAHAIYQMIPSNTIIRVSTIIFFIVAFISPILFFAFGEKLHIATAGFLYKFGTSWMIAFVFLFLALLLVDIFKLINLLFHFVDKETIRMLFKHNGITSMVFLGSIAILLIGGNLNYHHKKRISLPIQSDKVENPLKIVAISDLHLGYTISKKELSRWVEMINKEKPDLVIIGGDLVDNQLRPVLKNHLNEELKKIEAPLGRYACTGNHEYISGIKESVDFYKLSGITLLRDSTAHIAGLTIIGREDLSHKNRKTLKELTENIDPNSFTILLDHQPANLNDAMQEKIDFQFSGHTHYGQVFPISLITSAMFELAHGYKQKENTHYYVSSGLGIWGGKFRIGTRSEYLVLEINH